MEIPLGHYLAINLKDSRKSKGLSQKELAEKTQIPRSTIAGIESGDGNPTLQVMVKLSMGLDLRLEDLLKPPQPKVALYKKAEHAQVNKLNAGSKKEVIQALRMTPKSSLHVTIESLNFKAGQEFVGSRHPRGTEEYFICTHGQMIIEVEGTSYSLNKLDMLSFDGIQEHRYVASRNGESGGISVLVQVPGGA